MKTDRSVFISVLIGALSLQSFAAVTPPPSNLSLQAAVMAEQAAALAQQAVLASQAAAAQEAAQRQASPQSSWFQAAPQSAAGNKLDVTPQFNAHKAETPGPEVAEISRLSTAVAPQAANPQAANPQAANPQAVNPQVANPQAVNPQAANPQVANPQVANPQVANPQVANPQVANPQVANPQAVNPQVANPQVATVPQAAVLPQAIPLVNASSIPAQTPVSAPVSPAPLLQCNCPADKTPVMFAGLCICGSCAKVSDGITVYNKQCPDSKFTEFNLGLAKNCKGIENTEDCEFFKKSPGALTDDYKRCRDMLDSIQDDCENELGCCSTMKVPGAVEAED